MLTTVLLVLMSTFHGPATTTAPTDDAAAWIDAVNHDLPAIKDSTPDVDGEPDGMDHAGCVQW
jgi:hypothetical protein